MEELKFLSAAILALILAVSCQNEYDPAAGYSQMYGGAVIYEWRLDTVSLYSLKGIRLRKEALIEQENIIPNTCLHFHFCGREHNCPAVCQRAERCPHDWKHFNRFDGFLNNNCRRIRRRKAEKAVSSAGGSGGTALRGVFCLRRTDVSDRHIQGHGQHLCPGSKRSGTAWNGMVHVG